MKLVITSKLVKMGSKLCKKHCVKLKLCDSEGQLSRMPVSAPRIYFRGGTVAQWLALLPDSARDLGSSPASGDCLCEVCIFSPRLRGFSLGAPVSSQLQTCAS